MPLTPETLTRHELNGLRVVVVDAANPDLIGIAGRVVGETMRTLRIDCGAASPRRDCGGSAASDGSRVRQVPKRGTTFEFALPASDGADAPDRSEASVANAHTDEAAAGREAAGTATERGSEHTAAVCGGADPREAAAYVTVDGARLLSRPALRTETAGDTRWQ